MAPNFLTRLVKSSTPAGSNGSVPRDDGLSDSRPSDSHSHSQPPSSHLLPRTNVDNASDTHSHSSKGSFNIGVIPPTPRLTSSGFNDLAMEPAHTNDTYTQAHRRTRSNDRQIPDRHAISLAAYTMNVNVERSMGEDTLTTPTPSRYNMRHDNPASAMLEGSPSKSSRQLSPASSTGNLKGLIDKHTSRSVTSPDAPVQAVEKKRSKQSVRSRTQPPVPLILDQSSNRGRDTVGGRQDDPHEDSHNGVPAGGLVDSPTATTPPKAESHEFLSFASDPDVTSLKSAKSSGSKKKKKSGPGWRRPSVTTPERKPTSIASAIAAPGLAMANATSRVPVIPPVPPLPQAPKNVAGQNRSKAPSDGTAPSVDRTKHVASSSVHSMPGTVEMSDRQVSLSKSSDVSDRHYQTESSDSNDDGSESDDELEAEIPVTGFAVASNKRNTDFHELFPSVPEGDYLIEDYGCALQREILIQGRIYISENHICFHANIFGWITDLSIPIDEITALEKKMTAFVIPNAIQITTRQAKYTFASFLSRDTTFDIIANIWRLARPEYGVVEEPQSRTNSSRDIASASSISEPAVSMMTVPIGSANKVTHCSCSKNDGHLSEVALETVLPGTPDKIYNLMFASGFIKDFMRVDQKLTDIQISDWIPVDPGSKLLSRNMSYVKPLNNSVGPKQTKCEIHDENVYCDFDDHVIMMTSTKTPDVPSGGVFVVETRTCIMWASTISTRVIVTTQVEWTGRSFIKGLIERSAIEGQKSYHSDLDKAMRMYIQEHQLEFIPEGVDPCAVAPVEPLTPVEAPEPGLAPGASDEEVWKARERDRNRRGLQWAYETFEGTYTVAKRSTMGAIELVKEAWEQSSSTTILWFVIVALVFSNLWTLSLVGKREEAGRRKAAKKAVEKEKWVQEVVHSIWEEMSIGGARPGGSVPGLPSEPAVSNWREEVAGLRKTLDAVEDRVRLIRESLDALD